MHTQTHSRTHRHTLNYWWWHITNHDFTILNDLFWCNLYEMTHLLEDIRCPTTVLNMIKSALKWATANRDAVEDLLCKNASQYIHIVCVSEPRLKCTRCYLGNHIRERALADTGLYIDMASCSVSHVFVVYPKLWLKSIFRHRQNKESIKTNGNIQKSTKKY